MSLECRLEQDIRLSENGLSSLLIARVVHAAADEAYADGLDGKYGDEGFMLYAHAPKSLKTGEGKTERGGGLPCRADQRGGVNGGIRLSRDGFLKAKEAIFSGGSDVDRAWFRYQFEHEDTEAFLRVLAAHQYDNGGFGGLVHEFEYQGPCLKCTEHAFRYLYYLKENRPPPIRSSKG